jgi:hypothetical protein
VINVPEEASTSIEAGHLTNALLGQAQRWPQSLPLNRFPPLLSKSVFAGVAMIACL